MRKACAESSPRAAGFTLVEVLVVVVIIGLISGVVAMTLPDSRENAVDVAERFAARASYAAQESILSGEPIGVDLTTDAYQFYRYRAGRWAALSDEMFARARWPDEAAVTIERDGEAETTDKNADRESEELDEEEKEALFAPNVYFQPTGEATPFVLAIVMNGRAAKVIGDETGNVQLQSDR